MYDNPYASPYSVAAQPADARVEFYKKTYLHLAGSIVIFALLEAVLLQIPAMQKLAMVMMGSPITWLITLGIYMFTSHIAQRWAMSTTSKGTQYAGLGLFIVAEAIIFTPLLLIASVFAEGVITQAAIITLAMTAGITFIAFTTKKDFSFLNGFLKIGFFVALGLIIAASFIGGLTLGLWFAVAMVVLASVAILRDTSNIIHHYSTTQYVAASLGLFASIALLFWYVIQILMSLSSND
ncbi:Bax inhibitor-1 family protein [Rubritalea halochordaticola]